jgi:hypothetical protein
MPQMQSDLLGWERLWVVLDSQYFFCFLLRMYCTASAGNLTLRAQEYSVQALSFIGPHVCAVG